MAKRKKHQYIFVTLGAVAMITAVVFLVFSKKDVRIEKGDIDLKKMNLPISDLSGERCENAKERPIAVMLSSDPEARPLSGIGQADLVFEMPVTDSGTTRLMAVFQCHQPTEIGSVRSARSDFTPLARGLGAVFAHWGGEKEALAELQKGIINDLDALKYEGTIFYRQAGRQPPHNGFTSYDLLKSEVNRLGWGLAGSTVSYLHQEGGQSNHQENAPKIYKENFEVLWRYDQEAKIYHRWRAGQAEIDKNTSQAIGAANLILLHASWSPISKDYIRVQTVGEGSAEIYQGGGVTKGTWSKKGQADKLFFYDDQGQEVKLWPGPTWVEIVIS